MSKPSIAIIGPGKVGTALGILAARAGYTIAGIGARNLEKAQAAAAAVGRGVRIGRPEQIAPAGGLVLLTVSDDAIEPVCKQLAQAKAFARGAVVAHCCGAISSDVLSAARDRCGAAVGSMHPLQTFPSVEAGLEKFAGTYCFCEGDAPAVEMLETFSADLGGKPVRIGSSGKLLYHASAVMACNYLTGLLDAALATAGYAGIPAGEATAALQPLIRATLENIFTVGTAKALTGPIARGDEKLVARQYHDVTAADGRLGEVYRAMGAWTIDVALRKGTIDEAKAERLRRVFR